MLQEIFLGLGLIGIVLLACILILLPLICTLTLGTYFATRMGLTGWVWFSFVVIFFLGVMAILSVGVSI